MKMSPKVKEDTFKLRDVEALPGVLYYDGDVAIMEFNSGMHKISSVKLDMFAFICCAKGCLSTSLNGKVYDLGPNDLLHCSPGDFMNEQNAHREFSGYVIFISQKVMQDNVQVNTGVRDMFLSLSQSPVLRMSDCEIDMLRRYRELIAIRSNLLGRPYCKEVVLSIIRAILFELLANIKEQTPSSSLSDQQIRQKDILFRRFIDLLSSQETKPRLISWYSDKLCITPKYLSSLCKQVSQRTAFDWINEYMLIDIRQQLKYSEKSIKEIADYLGFPNVSFFGKYVRKHVGYSPGAYRKKLKEGA